MKTYLVYIVLFLFSFATMAHGKKFTISTQWTAQAQFAGYYVALKKGFYREAGVDVDIEHPSASQFLIPTLKNKKDNIITLNLMQAMIAREQGFNVVQILQASNHSGLVIITRPEITSLEQIRGKRVGRWRSGFAETVDCYFADKDIKVEWIPFITNINLLISGAIDATLGMSYNEYINLKLTGLRLTEKNVFYLSDLGYDIPEDGLYCFEHTYKEYEKEMKAIAAASRRGWEYAREHPRETLEIVYSVMEENNIPVNRVVQRQMFEEILRLQQDKPGGKANYRLDRDKFMEVSQMMMRQGQISNIIPYEEFVR